MDQRQFFLRDILTVIFKHLTLLVLLPLIILAVVFVGNYIWPPTYESTAKLQVMRGREVSQTDPTVTQSSSAVTMIQMGPEDINSEMQLLHSQNVLKKVVEDLQAKGELAAFPYNQGVLNAPFKAANAMIHGIMYMLKLREKPEDTQAAMDELDSRLLVEPVRDSYVLSVSLRLGDPDKAQSVLQTLLDVYKAEHINIFQSKQSHEFFVDQRKRVEMDLKKAQNDLQAFRNEHDISILDTEQEELLKQYTEAANTLNDMEQVQSVLTSENVDASVISTLSSRTENVVVREMQLRLFELLTELNRVTQSSGPAHPAVKSLKEQVVNMQKNLIEAISNVKTSTVSSLAKIKSRLEELNATRSELEDYEKRVELLADDFDLYAGKVEESLIADELAKRNVSNIQEISSPSHPVDPIRPNKVLNLGLALLGGIIASLAIAFFLDYLDHGLKTPEDVEYYVKVPPLASFFNAHGQALDPRQAERLAVLIDSVGVEGATKILMVTSSIGGEGSSQVASSLASAYANDPNMRTLLVDLSGDLARAKNARYGLTDVLLDQADFDEVFERENNITILGRGTHSDYPPHLWGSERMRSLLGELRSKYQHILIHVGPILQTQDALTVARHVDSILLVIKADSTRREVVSRALDSIRDSRPKIIGAVLTERTQTIPQAVYRRI